MSTDAVVYLRAEPADLRARFPYDALGPRCGSLGRVLVFWGEDFAALHPQFGPGCTAAELMEIIDRELPGVFAGVPQSALAVGLEGFEGGGSWEEHRQAGHFRLLSACAAGQSVWEALFGELPPERGQGRPEIPEWGRAPEESEADIEAMANALLGGLSLDALRERMQTSHSEE